jgi:Tol biopolymer transport system component
MATTWRQLLANQTARLCTFDLDSREKRVVLETTEAVLEAPNWTPDGTWLIYNQDGLIRRIQADGSGAPEILDTGDVRDSNNDHVLSADGRFLYVSSTDGHLYEIPAAGGPARRVSNDHAEPFIYYLHGISPDGQTLAYVGVQELDGKRFGRVNVFTIPVAGGDDIQLTDHGKPDDGPEYSPDGAWIYFNSEMASDEPGHMQLFRMRPDGAEVTQLTHDERVNWFPHLSPDGSELVYISYETGVVGHPADKDVILRRMDPDGGPSEDLVHLFGGQGTVNVNSWAPDSRRFAFVEYPVSGS